MTLTWERGPNHHISPTLGMFSSHDEIVSRIHFQPCYFIRDKFVTRPLEHMRVVVLRNPTDTGLGTNQIVICERDIVPGKETRCLGAVQDGQVPDWLKGL